MSYEIRPITPREFPTFVRRADAAFGGQPDQDDLDAQLPLFEFDRSLAVFDGPSIVGTAGASSFTLTLPGLTTLPVAGITYIGVLPTHRRQGLLRRLMARQLDDIAAHGEALAILYASESAIYGRFGYGIAAAQLGFTIERRHAAFARPPSAEGRLSLIEPEAAATILPDLYDQARLRQPGAIARGPGWWNLYFRDIPGWRDGAGPRFYVISHDSSGAPAGFAAYRVKHDWQGGIQRHVLILADLFGLSVDTYTALWHYLLNVDLIGTIRAGNRPIDEPLRWLLADPRRIRVSHLNDGLWVRLVDIPAALQARRYATSDRLIFEVTDPFRPRQSGRYQLDGGPSGADCRRTEAEPDLALQVDDLASCYLGGTRFSTLARAGRVAEHRPGALARADALFTCEPASWGTTHF
jgi:predicted acetyltransferase